MISCSLVNQFELADIELSSFVLSESHSIFQLPFLLYAALCDEFKIELLYHQIAELCNIAVGVSQVCQEDHAL